MKKFLFTIAALFCTTLLFAQEYMVIENTAGGRASLDVSIIKQATFVNYSASGEGTKESPFNVAAANARCKEIGEQPSSENYYVKGFVVSVGRNSDGPAAYIADDMTGINRLYVYRISLPNNVTLNYGDEVVIYGCLYNYRTITPEMEGAVVNINGQPYEDAGPQGTGTLDDPYNVAAVVNYTKSLGADVESPNDIYFTGIITNITAPFGTQYGNATFRIADSDNSNTSFYVYRCLYIGNVKYSDETAQNIKIGDRVLMCGKVVNYRGATPETVQNKAYVVSISSSQTGDEATPVTVAQFNEAAVSTDVWYKLTGTVNNLKDNDQYGNFDLVDETGSVYVYGLLSEKGGEKKKFQELVATYGIANGKKIAIIGNRGEYNSKIEVLNAYFVSIEGEGGGGTGGDVTSGTPAGTGTQADPFNIAAAIAKCKEVGQTASTENYYIKGIVETEYTVNNYKNATFNLIDHEGDTEKLMAYRVKGTDGKDLKEGYTIPKGATVIIYGPLVNYRGNTPETATGAYIVSVNGQAPQLDGEGGGGSTGGDANHGTAEAPLTVAQAIALIDAESTIDEAYVKGKISKIDSYNATYKSITYWISDDGTTTTLLQVYSGKGLNGADFAAKEDLTVGQTVVIKGKLKKYNTIYEFDKTSSIISIQ